MNNAEMLPMRCSNEPIPDWSNWTSLSTGSMVWLCRFMLRRWVIDREWWLAKFPLRGMVPQVSCTGRARWNIRISADRQIGVRNAAQSFAARVRHGVWCQQSAELHGEEAVTVTKVRYDDSSWSASAAGLWLWLHRHIDSSRFGSKYEWTWVRNSRN